MEKSWIFSITKEYSEEDYDSFEEAERQFIEDIAHNNFEINGEEVEYDVE